VVVAVALSFGCFCVLLCGGWVFTVFWGYRRWAFYPLFGNPLQTLGWCIRVCLGLPLYGQYSGIYEVFEEIGIHLKISNKIWIRSETWSSLGKIRTLVWRAYFSRRHWRVWGFIGYDYCPNPVVAWTWLAMPARRCCNLSIRSLHVHFILLRCISLMLILTSSWCWSLLRFLSLRCLFWSFALLALCTTWWVCWFGLLSDVNCYPGGAPSS
jgi:hypothetical protein